jgi:uncharacterized protein (DUF58 family)
VPRWSLSVSLTAGIVVAIIVAALGLFFARVDVALIAVPLLISAAWAWDHRPRPAQNASVEVRLDPGAAGIVESTTSMRLPSGVDSALIRMTTLGVERRELLIAPETAAALRTPIPVLHSGPQEFLRIELRLIAQDAAQLSSVEGPLVVRQVISPAFVAVSNLPLPSRLQGTSGNHVSARPGDGGDFRDVHPFAPGDRLRRIDWKATARRAQNPGDLYVRRTTATADATILVVIDSRDDVGENVVDWGSNTATEKGRSSMDIAREAASALTAGYLKGGDRVGFQDLATQSRAISPGGGTRHLHRLLRSIELAEPAGAPARRQRPPAVTSGALIYVLSTFLDDEAGRMATFWRAAGHRVIAVDVLPAPRLERLDREEGVAHRMVMMERDDRIRNISASGVELLRWPSMSGATGIDSPEVQLRILSRPGRAPR